MPLAVRQRCEQRITCAWPGFLARRRERLAQQDRYGKAAEKVAETILEDLFTTVLDWPLSALNYQVGYADLVLTSLGVKSLIVEVKRPGTLAWRRSALQAALDQARRYATEQKVRCIGVSDGEVLYAADVKDGELSGRTFVRLTDPQPPLSLWWLGVHGIYREVDTPVVVPEHPLVTSVDAEVGEAAGLVHPRYRLPASCFAYVGDPTDPRTWKLPYLLGDGTVDVRRLPKAVQAVLTNYRGLKVGGIPENAVPDVLVRLGRAAARLGRMPGQCAQPAPVYQQLAAALDQYGRLAEATAQPSTPGPDRAPAGRA